MQGESDYYRTRLTHSLEVAQIARTTARVLALDEDLAEAVALAHDLGHTPFGHAGEEALAAASAEVGGFDHNAHGLRLVTKLEHRYAGFDGLNLTWETLEGLVKHNGPIAEPVPVPIAGFDASWPLDLSSWPGLEAQIAAHADDIAYLTHDIDDGLRAGLFKIDDLAKAPLAGAPVAVIRKRYGELELSRFIGELVRTLIGAMADDLLAETGRILLHTQPGSAADVRAARGPTAGFSPEMTGELEALRQFLFVRMYRHLRVMSSMDKAKMVVEELFGALSREPSLLPADWAAGCGQAGDGATARMVRDYIAGMTDRFALQEYRRIFHKEITL